MALRVLLADESSTIKKAIQMALSDLGVDVKSVPSGLDVLTVSRTFQPDVILADILLTKKNGYEVCAEIKADPQLKNTPVILMWSSFMQLDQTQFARVKADASLEKPFDSETLREVVERHVPRLSQSPLRGLLNHAELPDFEESETFVKQRADYTRSQATPDPAMNARGSGPNSGVREDSGLMKTQVIREDSGLMKTQVIPQSPAPSMDPDEVDEFSEVPLKPKKKRPAEADDWESATADQFVIETESLDDDFEEVTVMTNGGSSETGPDLQRRIQKELETYIEDAPLARNRAGTSGGTQTRVMSNLEEQIMKEEIRMMAEKICWQILPEITEKIVREELSKLLNGLEKV